MFSLKPAIAPGTPRARRSLLEDALSYVHAHHGDSGVRMLLAAAPVELRKELEAVSRGTTGWGPIELVVETVELVDMIFGAGDRALAWEMGHYAGMRSIGAWHVLALRRSTPEAVVSVAAAAWRERFSVGRIDVNMDRTGALLTLVDFPPVERVLCQASCGYAQGVAELGPRPDVQVTEASCRASGAASCAFRIRWP